MFETGDILFKKGDSFISKIIKNLTFGKVTHVGLIYDEDTVFETDGAWMKAEKHDIFKQYKGKDIEVYRMVGMSDLQKQYIRALCEEYKGTPYSFWDVAVKGILFWMHPKMRGKVAALLGNEQFMICNELVMMIMYKATGLDVFKEYESSNPAELYQEIKHFPSLFRRVI